LFDNHIQAEYIPFPQELSTRLL